MPWIALIPPLTTLIAVFLTRRVILSLALAVITGSFLKSGFTVDSLITAGNYIAGSVSQKENAYTLVFLVLFGSLAELIKVSGGIAGFRDIAGRRIKSERGVLVATWALLPFTFFDNSFRSLSVGSILGPLMEKVNGSKEKLAFVLTVTTGQVIVLIPLATAYVAYMVSLVRASLPDGAVYGYYEIFLKSLFWNFYSLAMIGLAVGVSLWGLKHGTLRLEALAGEEKLTEVHLKKLKFLENLPPEFPARVINLIVPITTLLVATIFFFWWTGKSKAGSFFASLGNADFAVSIMAGTLLALVASGIFFWLQKINFAEIEGHVVEGGQSVLNLLVILVLSWALSQVVRDLGFSKLVSSTFAGALPAWAIPAAVFLAGAAISYVIGSSWATWALLMPLAASLIETGNLNPAMIFGAVWAGGSVGDSTSPLSDIPILVSSILNIPVGKYASGALPFAIAGIAFSTIAYMVVSFAGSIGH